MNKYGLDNGWRKLNKLAAGSTRTLSLPLNMYKYLGFTKDDVLLGRWGIVDGKLMLEIKKMESAVTDVTKETESAG